MNDKLIRIKSKMKDVLEKYFNQTSVRDDIWETTCKSSLDSLTFNSSDVKLPEELLMELYILRMQPFETEIDRYGFTVIWGRYVDLNNTITFDFDFGTVKVKLFHVTLNRFDYTVQVLYRECDMPSSKTRKFIETYYDDSVMIANYAYCRNYQTCTQFLKFIRANENDNEICNILNDPKFVLCTRIQKFQELKSILSVNETNVHLSEQFDNWISNLEAYSR